jgi:predicted nucleic acid-binding Zn ribbon protein
MNLGAIFVGASMLVIAVPFIVIPFQKGRMKNIVLPMKSVDPEEQRISVLSSLRDLDFDFQIGKVSDDDYTNLRGQLVIEAAQSLQEDDKVDEIEALIQARKASKAKSSACVNCGEPIETGNSFCSHCGTAVTPSCPSCGMNIKAGDLFCSSCGNQVTNQVGS